MIFVLQRSGSFLRKIRNDFLKFRAMANSELPKDILGFEVKDIDGNIVSLSKFKGYVLLIVNVASKCGFTNSNYPQLQDLHKK